MEEKLKLITILQLNMRWKYERKLQFSHYIVHVNANTIIRNDRSVKPFGIGNQKPRREAGLGTMAINSARNYIAGTFTPS